MLGIETRPPDTERRAGIAARNLRYLMICIDTDCCATVPLPSPTVTVRVTTPSLSPRNVQLTPVRPPAEIAATDCAALEPRN